MMEKVEVLDSWTFSFFGICLASLLTSRALVSREQSDWLYAIPMMSILVFFSTQGTYQTLDQRIFGKTHETYMFQKTYVLYQIFEIMRSTIEDKKNGLYFGMLAHHVLSCVAYGGGLLTGRFHFWACLAGNCEISTIFLCVLMVFKKTEDTTLYSIISWPTMFMYFLTRLVLFPIWLYMWAYDFFYDAPFTANGTVFELTFYPFTICFLFVFSAYSLNKLYSGHQKKLSKLKKKA